MRWAFFERRRLSRPACWRFAALLLLALVLQGVPPAGIAQNLSHTVVTRELRFARGSSGAQVNGRADHAMSHVYTLGVRAGQTMTVALQSPEDAVTFSVIAPEAGTLADGFGVTHWQGVLTEGGKYQLVLVMNDEARRRVPYRLQVTVR